MNMLLAMLAFGDDDPDLHVHFTRHMQHIEQADPVEFVRVLRTLEEGLAEYGARLYRVRLQIETRLTEQAEHQEATSG